MTPVMLEPAAPRSRVKHTALTVRSFKSGESKPFRRLIGLQEFSRAEFLQVFTRSVTLIFINQSDENQSNFHDLFFYVIRE